MTVAADLPEGDSGSLDAKGNRWAASPLAADPGELLISLERGFPVRLITTFDPRTCEAGASIADVITDPTLAEFDHLPVVDEQKIVGLVTRDAIGDDRYRDQPIVARDVMRRLDESILISSDDSILSFIQTADTSQCRLVLDKKRISGIVTISDLQQLPVRPVLFLLVTHVELLLAELIRARGPSDEVWMTWIASDRQEKIAEKWQTLSDQNLGIDRLSATEFCDKREIARRIVDFGIGRNKLEEEMRSIEWLRNSVAHAGDYALKRANSLKTVSTVRLCNEWIKRLTSILKSPSVTTV